MNKLKKGDTVQILLGKDRGKSGQIERVLTKKEQIVVGGLNVYKRHVKGRMGIEGGIIDLVKPMNLSNVALICPNCKKMTRVGFKVTDSGKMRVCKKCGKEIGK
jgi:large subunit ribosomal protein L24